MNQSILLERTVFGNTNKIWNLCVYLKLVLILFLVSGILSGKKAFAADCGGTPCGGDQQRCFAYPIPYPGVPNVPVECTTGTPSGYQPCGCDTGLDCSTATMYCGAYGGLGEKCFPPRPGTCDPPYVCNETTDETTGETSATCGNEVGGCNAYKGPCCYVGGTGYCNANSLYGDMTCEGAVCVPADPATAAECVYGRVSGNAQCCNDEGEGCCGNLQNTCYEGWECVSGFCRTPGTPPNCGLAGLNCCSTAVGGLSTACTDGSAPQTTGAGCTCVNGDNPAFVDVFFYDGPIIRNIAGLLAPIFKILFYAGVFIGILGIIYSGYLLIASEGDPGRVKEGKDQLTAAILGTLFVLLSVLILRVIINNILGVTNSGL